MGVQALIERKMHLMTWKKVSRGKAKGGLGIKSFHLLNKALLGKWIWRFAGTGKWVWRFAVTGKWV